MTSPQSDAAETAGTRAPWLATGWASVRGFVARRIAIDTRTLAIFRMMMGALVVVDLALRARRFTFHYTEDGAVPRWLAQNAAPDNAFSVYFFTTDANVTALLFVVQGLIAVSLIVGYQTRVAVILSFLLLISLSHRNIYITSYADTLFRLLMFWAMFLPLSERWSIDAVHRGTPARAQIVSVASAAILLQMIYMYLVNGYRKWEGGMWNDGEAVILIFGLDDITYLLGEPMRSFPTLLQYGGVLWYVMLLGSPLLLLLMGRLRMLFVGFFLGGHAAFAVTVRIGSFPQVAIAGVLLFLQARAWDDGKALLRVTRTEAYVERMAAFIERGGRGAARYLPDLIPRSDWTRDFGARSGQFMLAVALLAVLVIPSITELSNTGAIRSLPDGVERRNRDITAMFGVRQPPWTVFAPSPRRTDYWYVFSAQTADGDLLDVYNDRPLSFERPFKGLQRQYPTYRERFYMNAVRRAGETGNPPFFLAEYLCRTWMEDRGIELTHINFYAIAETVTVETVNRPEDRVTSRTVTYRHGCGDNEPMDLPEP